jgi:hypothetical protein
LGISLEMPKNWVEFSLDAARFRANQHRFLSADAGDAFPRAPSGSEHSFSQNRRVASTFDSLGSIGYFVMNLSNAISAYTITGESPPSPAVLQWWGVLDNIGGVATVLLPIGLLAFALHATRRI